MTFQQEIAAIIVETKGNGNLGEVRSAGMGLTIVVPAGLITDASVQQTIIDRAAVEPHPISVVMADRDDPVITAAKASYYAPQADPWQWTVLSTTTGEAMLPLATLGEIVTQI